MTNTHVRTRVGLGTALVALAAGLLAALVLAAPAPAAKLSGKTTLAPKAATFETLADAGVIVTPSGVADAGNKGISFPIAGGKVSLDNLNAKIKHRGGLTFSGAGTSVTLQGYVLKLGNKNVIRARIAGADAKVRLANLDIDNARVRTPGGKAVISNVKVLLAGNAAKALSAIFGLPNLTGANLGKASVKVKS
jgi:hypothetical protein